MTSFTVPTNLSKPTQSTLESAPRASTHRITSQGNQFQFLIDSKTVWEHALPDPYQIHNGRMIENDACHQQPDGGLVSAVGQALYECVQRDRLVSQAYSFEPNASFMLQDNHAFYFSCRQGRIDQLHMCPPGQYFQISSCRIVDQCAGQKDGKRLPDPFDTQRYYECRHEKPILKSCPPDTYFVNDQCYDPLRVGLYCQVHSEPKILDYKTLLVCRQGRIAYEICPPGYRYFDSPKCEPEPCVGKPDGHRIPLPPRRNGPLSYSPGYTECVNEKVILTQTCSETWDSHLTLEGNLTHLPQVFDGHNCTIPEFCTNVTSDDPDVIVPIHKFTKHVRNWIYSETFDRLEGYKCEGSTRKRVAVDPGNLIHPKRLKQESACVGQTERVVIPFRHDGYFDCTTQTVQTCPADTFFDGHECRSHIPHAFKFYTAELFQFNSLRADNWMEPWAYSKLPSVAPCTAPESTYNEIYNICSHPDCALYPWLSQIPFEVALRDGSLCKFDTQYRYVRKHDTEDKYLYWAQRRVEEINPQEPCKPGQNLQSGHFVFDRTIFATCDESQPFVFCPSSSTQKIIELKNGEKTRWACESPGMIGEIPSGTTVAFTDWEVAGLFPTDNQVMKVLIDGQETTILPTGYVNEKKFKLQTLDQPVRVEYAYRITHPPDVAFPASVYANDGAYLIGRKSFTHKSVEIPMYGIKDAVTSFIL
ncbi:hypothetical protein AVEN_261815-1 [Araneus ventricosus]|uniref:Chitin-binding type-2 domain-containing protein n=1 Tax=Araneus ventricosus TaxID=182803 RepID=A0A4Y2LY57_ARAVE|nr:hypothetical protein AVEN_261815-1 [Araneus ventricosus]